MKKTADHSLHEALKKAYGARACLFLKRIEEKKVFALIADVEKINCESLHWDKNLEELGISETALSKMKKAGVPLHYMFAHPDILKQSPSLLEYYRNLAVLSKKGLSQILSGLDYDRANKNFVIAKILNTIISEIIEAMKGFQLDVARSLILAEIGAEIQGAWVNIIGQGAAKTIEKIIRDHASKNDYIKPVGKSKSKPESEMILKNGWRIIFGSEPDIAIRDPKGVLQLAIEIKGSMDKAGAQTRYGEAKKSFAKALAENPRCETIYLASCYTQAVIKQIEADGQIRQTYNLVDILNKEDQRQAFLAEIFKFRIRIEK